MDDPGTRATVAAASTREWKPTGEHFNTSRSHHLTHTVSAAVYGSEHTNGNNTVF